MVERDGRRYLAVRAWALGRGHAPATAREWARTGAVESVRVVTESGNERLYIAEDADTPVRQRVA
jgi:hypothetical protein